MPAAGKTTLANLLCQRLRSSGEPACLLDGDLIRQGLCRDLGYSPADRAENVRRVAELARLLNESSIHAVVALISPTIEGRANARSIVGDNRFIEVHVATPLAVCQVRDPKKLYAKAMHTPGMGMTGLDAPYEAPPAPAVVIDTVIVAPGVAVEMMLAVAASSCGTSP